MTIWYSDIVEIINIYLKLHHLLCICFHPLFFVAIAVRDKLESLCRELQRQNKMLMV